MLLDVKGGVLKQKGQVRKWNYESLDRYLSDTNERFWPCGSIVVKALNYKREGHGFETP